MSKCVSIEELNTYSISCALCNTLLISKLRDQHLDFFFFLGGGGVGLREREREDPIVCGDFDVCVIIQSLSSVCQLYFGSPSFG